MHDFVSKLGSDGVVREWFIEVGEGSSWGNVAPVQQMVQLEIGKILVVNGMLYELYAHVYTSILNHQTSIFTVDKYIVGNCCTGFYDFVCNVHTHRDNQLS